MPVMCPSSIWRLMTPDDLISVTSLATQIHTDYPEDAAVFANRLQLAPDGCFVLNKGALIEGYILSHPWFGCITPKLNAILTALPQAPDRWYIHDIVLSPATRGLGLAGTGIALMETIARSYGLPCISLVSTRLALKFWEKQGFTPENISTEEEKVLASYDPEARLLSRIIAD